MNGEGWMTRPSEEDWTTASTCSPEEWRGRGGAYANLVVTSTDTAKKVEQQSGYVLAVAAVSFGSGFRMRGARYGFSIPCHSLGASQPILQLEHRHKTGIAFVLRFHPHAPLDPSDSD